jgi:hypothetical protein
MDNFLGRISGMDFGRFFMGRRPWRWRQGGFFHYARCAGAGNLARILHFSGF